MFKLGKIALTGSILAGLFAASIAIAPAANAATVDPGWHSFRGFTTKVAGHVSNVTVTASNKKVVTLSDKSHAYTSYKVVVKGASTHTVYFSKTLSPWRTIYAVDGLSSNKIYNTTAKFGVPAYKAFSTADFAKFKSHLTKASVSTLKKERNAFWDLYGYEDGVLYDGIGNIYWDIQSWWKSHKSATSFSGYNGTLSKTDSKGIVYKTSGTPAGTFTVKATLPNGHWISLSHKVYQGSYTDIPAASSNTASGSGMWTWIKANYKI